jgi:hypothetical protein
MKCLFIKKDNGKYEIDLETDEGCWSDWEEESLEDILTSNFIKKIMLENLK